MPGRMAGSILAPFRPRQPRRRTRPRVIPWRAPGGVSCSPISGVISRSSSGTASSSACRARSIRAPSWRRSSSRRSGDGQAVLFESVRGSAMPLRRQRRGRPRHGRARPRRRRRRPRSPTFLERSRRRVPPVVVRDAPVQDVVHTGDAVDLRRLPLIVHAERDAAPYFTGGPRDRAGSGDGEPERLVQPHDAPRPGRGRHPDDAAPSTSARSTSARPPAARTCPVAVAIGNHPAELVGGRHHRRLRRRRAGTGRRAPGRADRAGPVRVDRSRGAGPRRDRARGRGPGGRRRAGRARTATSMQFYVPVMPEPCPARLTAITHRRDAIHQTMHAGQAEDTHAALRCRGGAAPRGRRRHRRRRPPGEPAPDDPRPAPSASGSGSRASRSRSSPRPSAATAGSRCAWSSTTT